MKKITISFALIGLAAVAAVGATTAFFSDTETSSGNTFTAGAIDLTIDNASYAVDYTIPNFNDPTGALAASPNTSWSLNNLTDQLFFNFADLKPGDFGEDTISLHVDTNDAYACMRANITANDDNTIVEPEDQEDGTPGNNSDGTPTGDLADQLNFAFWAETDGDNVFEDDETTFWTGTAESLFNDQWTALADSAGGPLQSPLTGGGTYFVGKFWCFGEIAETPKVEDNSNQGPLIRGTGFTCNGGAIDNNLAQTDSIGVDVSFHAIQSRNNGSFTCSSLNEPPEGQDI